jgi:hypothetical protein
VPLKISTAITAVAGTEDPEEDEDWSLRLNNDDDNDNGIEDMDELVGPIDGEDDLEQVTVDYWLRDDAYEADYMARFWTEGGIRLW